MAGIEDAWNILDEKEGWAAFSHEAKKMKGKPVALIARVLFPDETKALAGKPSY